MHKGVVCLVEPKELKPYKKHDRAAHQNYKCFIGRIRLASKYFLVKLEEWKDDPAKTRAAYHW